MIHRLYVGGQQSESVVACLVKCGLNATIYHGLGVWEGQREHSTIVEVIGEKRDRHALLWVARRLLWGALPQQSYVLYASFLGVASEIIP